MSFALDISKFSNKVDATLDETCRAIKISLFSSVIMDTRVGNPDGWISPAPPGYVGGRLRGNWQTTTGNPNMDVVDRIDPTGSDATREVESNVKGDTVDYMTNNLPYAEVYEEKDGMIAKNMVRINRIVKESIKG